jgi:hypothetical protein
VTGGEEAVGGLAGGVKGAGTPDAADGADRAEALGGADGADGAGVPLSSGAGPGSERAIGSGPRRRTLFHCFCFAWRPCRIGMPMLRLPSHSRSQNRTNTRPTCGDTRYIARERG